MRNVINLFCAVLLVLLGCQIGYAAKFSPASVTVTGSATSYCFGATGATALTASSTNTSCAATTTATTVTCRWYYNTTNTTSTTNAVLLQTSTVSYATSGALPALPSYTPNTQLPIGTSYIFLELSWTAAGCLSAGAVVSSTVAITINGPNPILGGGSTLCPSQSLTLTDATSGGTWSVTGSTGSTVTSGGVFTAGSTVGTATVSYTVSGCSRSIGVNVASAPLFAATAAASPTTVCVGATSNLTATLNSSRVYNVAAIAASPVTLSSPTAVGASTDDQTSSPIALGFTFNYYGVNYTKLKVCTNGWATFDTTVTSTTFTNAAIPSATINNRTICLTHNDIRNVVAGTGVGSCTYQMFGSAPNRYFVISYNNCYYASTTITPNTALTAQIIIYETSNIIELVYTRMTATTAMTAGLQNTSTQGIAVPGRNAASAGGIFNPEAWRFTPITLNPTYSWAGGSVAGVTTSAATATVSATTTYTITVSDASTPCGATSTVTVTGNPLPTLTVNPTNACYGINMVASGTGNTYAWSPATGLSATTGATVMPTPASATTYTVVSTITATGCTNTTTKTVNLIPTIGVSPTSSIFCSGLTPIALTATGGTTYSWAPNTLLSATTGAAVNASPTTTVTYTVTGTTNGCSATATSLVTGNRSLGGIVPFVASDTTICMPGYALMTETGTGGTWSSGNPSIFTVDASGNISPVSAGDAKVYYTSPCGTDSLTLHIVTGGFTVSVTPSSGTYCASGSALTLTASSTGGADLWLWTNFDGSAAIGLSSTSIATVSASPSVTATYAVFGTNSSTGCHAVTTVTVTNNTPAAITGTNTVCAGSTRTYACTTGGGTWSSSNPTVATVNSGTGVINGLVAGTATITYTVTATGCYVTRNITVNALPTLSFTPTSALACGGVGVAVTASGAVSYTWAPNTALSATTGATVTATPGSATVYTITGTDANGCVNTGTKSVGVGATYVSAFYSPAADTVCPGATDVLTATASTGTTYSTSAITYSATSTAGFTAGPSGDDNTSGFIALPFTFNFFGVNYTQFSICTNGWMGFTTTSTNRTNFALPSTTAATTMGPLIALGLHDMNTGSGSINYGTTGTAPNRVFTISFNSYGDFSCGGTNTGQIKLYESSNVVDILVSSLSGTCANTVGIQNAAGTTAYTFTSPTINGTTGPISLGTPAAYRYTPVYGAAVNYSWSPAGTLSASTGSPVTATVSSATTYTVTVTDPATGCNGSYSRTINNYTNPTVAIGPSTVCVGTTMNASGASTYTWSPATGLSATTGASVATSVYTVPSYTVTGTDSHGCTATASKSITYATVNVTPSPTIFCSAGSPVALTASGSAVSYSWSPAAGLSATTGATVNASPTGTTVYSVIGTDGTGCTGLASDSVYYNVTPTTITGTTATICLPGSTVLSTDGTGGIWSSSAPSVATVNPVTGLVTGVSADTCTIYYTNSTCGTVSYALTVANGGFTVTTAPTSGTYCASGSPFNIVASDGGAGATFSWSPAAGLDVTTGASVNASPTVTTTYLVVGTVGACTNSATITITNNTPAAIGGGATAVCVGSNTTWTDATSGGTWSSSLPGIATVNSATGVITGVAAGSATITYQVTATSCYVTRNITVNPLPTLAFTPTTAAACGGTGVAVTASGASTYSWAPGTGLSATTGATVTANPASATTYTITGTSAAGCVSTGTKAVNVGVAMTAFISPASDTVCPGATDVLTGNVASSATSYTVSSISYTAFPTTGFSAGPSGDDANSSVTIPFTFNFFGINYTTLNLNTNGGVHFGTAVTTGYPAAALPNGTQPTGFIGLFFHDMNTGSGSISFGTIGTAPYRKFVLSYNAYGDFTGTGTNTGQIVLYESSNVIECHVNTTTSTNAYTKVCGIQNIARSIGFNATGRDGIVYNITTPEAWRFTPSYPSATYAWAGSTTSASTGTPVTATVSGTQTYTVTATDPATGCSGSFSRTINNYVNPTISISPSVVCVGTPMTASGASTYTWSPATGIATTTGATVTPSSYVATTYTVTGTDNHTCTGTATKAITFPSLTVSPSSTIFCSAGSPASLTASGTSVSYSWSPSAGLSATVGASVTASPGSTTIYTVTGTDGSGCTNQASDTVTYNVTPSTITAAGGSSTICLPGTLALSTDGTGGSWSSSNTGIATVDGAGVVTGVAAGTVTITYNNVTCGFVTYGITVAPGGFTVTTTPGSGTYCSTGSALSITASDGGAGASFTWSPASGLSSTAGATVSATPTVTTTYTVTGTAGACSNSATITVTNNTPAAIAGGVTAICVGLTTTWTDATASGSWSSSAPGVATVNPSTGVIFGVSAGTATITYDVSGCYVTRSITVNPTPTFSFTPSSAYACGGIGVAVTVSGASTYTWSPATGLSATTGATVTANPGSTTTYTITGTSAAGCIGTGTKLVSVGTTAMMAYGIGTPSSVCPGTTTTLSGAVASSTVYTQSTITYATTPTTGFSAGPAGDDNNSGAISLPFTFNYFGVNYNSISICTNGWISFSASSSTNLTNFALPSTTAATTMGPLIAMGMHDMNTGSGNINFGTVGTAPNRTFVISWNAYGDFSCGGTNTGQIKLYESSNVIDLLVGSLSGTCSNTVGIQNAAGTTAYTMTSPTINGTAGAIGSLPAAARFTPNFPSATYSWVPTTGVASTASATTTATVSATTVYTVTVTDPASGCNGSFATTVNTFATPTVTVSPTVVCAGTPMTASGALTYTWGPAATLSATNLATVTASPTVSTTYTVTGTDTNGCVATATKTINFPTVSLTPTSGLYCSSGSPVSITASGTATTFSWAPSGGLSATTGTSVTASPTVTTVYTVTGTDTSGCTNNAYDTITYNIATSGITGPSSTLCLPGTMVLTQAGTGGTWSSSDTTLSVVNSSGLVTGIAVGSYTITYNNAACGGFATYALTNVSGGFTISVTPSSGTYCSTGTALNATASGATTYVWLPSAGLDVTTGATVNASPTVTTVYTVTGTTSGCSNSATLTVTNNTPAPIVGGVTTLCSGLTTTWTDATASGSWSSSAAGVATVSTGGVITGVTGGTATITYNVSGCYVTRNITINATPSLSFTPAVAASCAGAGIVVTASGATTYSWTPSSGLSSTIAASVTATPTITTTYTITGTSAAGCVATGTKTVNVSGTAMRAYASSTPTQVCIGGITTLSGAVASSATAYTTTSISHSPAATTGFSAGPAGDDVNSGAISLPFTFNYFGVDYNSISICTNGWISFSGSTSTNLTNFALPSTTAATTMGPLIALGMHDMNTGGGTISFGTLGTAPNRTFVVSWNSYGDFSCGGTNTGQIKLYESSNVVDLLVSSLSGTCSNTVGIQNGAGTIAYTFTSPTINGTTGAISGLPAAYRYTPSFPSATYSWLPTSGVTSTAAATTTATVTATTTYTVTVTDPASGCFGTYTTTDTAVAQPTVSLTTTQTSFCSGGQDSLIAVPSGGVGPITSYTWSGPGISSTTGAAASASFNPTVAATTTGLYTVSVAYAGSGCNPAVNTSASVTIQPDPIVTVSPSSTSICSGNTLVLTESLVSGGLGTPTYSWSGPGITTTTGTTATSPTFTPTPSAGSYSVAVTYTGRGCDVANASTSTVNVYPIPTITLGASPSICQPTTGTVISYSGATGSPTTYDITWGAGAITAGFSNVTGATLSGGTIPLAIPTTTVTGTYTASVTVYNAGACPSATSYPFTLTIYAYPTASITSYTPPCMGYGAVFVFTGTSGAVAAYKIDGGSPINVTMTGGTYTLTTAAITSSHTYTLYDAHNPVCTTVIDTSVVVNPIPMAWTGTVSSNWNRAANWSCGFVPGASDDVTIPTGTPYSARLDTGSDGTTRSLTLNSGATVAVLGTHVLDVKGNLTNNGSITGTGKTSFSGTSAQTASGFGSVSNLNINNAAGVTINTGSKVTVKSVLSLVAGNLYTSDSLVLFADSSATARVDSIPSGDTIIGQAKVMVYVPGGRRAYRFWSHPFTGNIGLSQAQNYIDVTGPGGASNGFTTTASNAPSAFRYNPLVGNSSALSDPGWRQFASTSTSTDSNRIHRYQGIRLFFRGAKGEGLYYATGYTPSPVSVTQWGSLNQGTQVVTLAKGSSNPYQEYNMIGNPYASPVDIGTIAHNALVEGNIVGAGVFVWNPYMGAGGQYLPVFINTVSATPYYLAACNSFQARAAFNGATMTFNENHKGSTPSAGLFKSQQDYVSLKVYDAAYNLYDMVYLRFDDAATDGDDYYADAVKPFGGAALDFYSLSSDKEKMTIDARPFNAEKVIPLGLVTAQKQDYIIKAEGVTVPDGGSLYLHDKLLKQYVLLEAGTEYRFSVTADAKTQGDNRFELSMKSGNSAVPQGNKGLQVNIAPNPATDDVNISFTNGKSENVSVRILDLSGVSIYNRNLGVQLNGTINVSMGSFASGIYMVELTSGNQKVVQRLVKE